jgi:hydroxyacylglutathione hydrolase
MHSLPQQWSHGGLTLLQLPVLKDNYVYLIHSAITREVTVIDPAVSMPVIMALQQQGWKLTHIFNTHHHGDHVGGNRELVQACGCKVFGYVGDAARIPHITTRVNASEQFEWGRAKVEVLFLAGHTSGHIAYYFPEQGWLFCGDVVFMMGCGRLFEGTPAQMFASLQRVQQLPDETLIFCAHEYTEHNGNFALTVEGSNPALVARMEQVRAARQRNQATVPATLAMEKQTNPFLRAHTLEAFAALREARNSF